MSCDLISNYLGFMNDPRINWPPILLYIAAATG
jgi:hypothetical protein